jgi:hypothetical protein
VNTDTEDIQLEGEVKGSVVDKKAEPAKGSAEASSEKASPEKAPLPPPDKGQPASGPGGAE